MTEREIEFTSSDGYALAGELVLPDGEGPFVCAVLQQGSVLANRDGQTPRTDFRSTLYRRLARMFAQRGIATFRYDKRQWDWPAPKPLTYSLTDRVNDLVAAFEVTKQQGEVQNDALAIVGHSEGGIVAQLAALQTNPSRIAVLASPAISLLETMAWRVRQNRMAKTLARRRSGLIQQEGVDELIRLLESGEDLSSEEFEAFKDAQGSKSAIQGWESWVWLKEHHQLKITDSTAKLPCPALFLHGDHDHIVASDNLKLYEEVAQKTGRTDLVCETMTNLGHYLEDTRRKAFTVHEELIDRVARWLLERQ